MQQEQQQQTWQHEDAKPSRVIFIRGLQSLITEEQLRETFSAFGEIRKLFNIVARGMCFITYFDIRDATAALSRNGAALGDITLQVDFAVPKGVEREDPNADTLFIRKRGGLVFDDSRDDDLTALFMKYGAGDVQKVRGNARDGHCKFIQFYDVRSCERALVAAEEQPYEDGLLHVELAKSQMGVRKKKWNQHHGGNNFQHNNSYNAGGYNAGGGGGGGGPGRHGRRSNKGRRSRSRSRERSSRRRRRRRSRSRSKSREKRRRRRRSRSRSKSRSRSRSPSRKSRHRSSSSGAPPTTGTDPLASLGLTEGLAGHLLQLLQQQGGQQQPQPQQQQQHQPHNHQQQRPQHNTYNRQQHQHQQHQHQQQQQQQQHHHHTQQPPPAQAFDPQAFEKLKHSLAALKNNLGK